MVAAMSLYKGMKEKSITQKIESEFWKVKRRIFFLVKRYNADFLVGVGASEVVLLILVPVVQFGFGCLWMDFLLSSIF